MGIESLQKAALAAGFVMATPDDDPPSEEIFAEADETVWQPAAGQWLVPVSGGMARRPGAREAVVSAAAWIRDHLPLMGGRAPA